MAETETWKAHVYRVGQEHFNEDAPPDGKQATAEGSGVVLLASKQEGKSHN